MNPVYLFIAIGIGPVWCFSSPFIVVTDGGSSHTAFSLYKIAERDKLTQVTECSIDGGLDEFVLDPSEIGEYFYPCLMEILSNIAPSYFSETPIYLGATAGMRLLSQQDPQGANLILEEIREIFSDIGLKFELDFVSILTGEEEGFYSLLTANMLAHGEEGGVPALSSGILDMGGASAQIAFPCPDQQTDSCQPLNLSGTHTNIFAMSNLCYGLEEALKRYVALQILATYNLGLDVGDTVVNVPCLHLLPSGGRDSWLTRFPSTVVDIFSSPCTQYAIEFENLTTFLSTLPPNYEFSLGSAYTSTQDCLDSIKPLIQNDLCESIFADGENNCLNMPRSVPVLDYFAMSSYFWEFRILLQMDSESIELEEARVRLEAECEREWGPEAEDQTNCFQLSYIFLTLTQGYGFDEVGFRRIQFLEDINGAELSWTLGFAATILYQQTVG